MTRKLNYRVQSVTIEMPSLISDGLNDASRKYKLSKSDIVRSVMYDFLVSSGILPENKDLNGSGDIYIESVGRLPTLLAVE